MKVHWTETAERHLEAIYAFMHRILRTVDQITWKSQQIGEFPMSGRRVQEYDMDQIREIFLGSYRIIYHIKSDQIDVIAVLHGSMEVL